MLLDAGVWGARVADVPKGGPCRWGVDLGTTAAMCAVTAYWPHTGRLETLGAFPGKPSLAKRGLSDGVGNLYNEMLAAGDLIVLGGNVVPVGELLTEAAARFGTPASVAVDRWRAGELADGMTAAGVYCPVEFRGMGFRDGAEDVRRFRVAFLEGRVRPRASLLMESAMAETVVVTDEAGNQKVAKNTQGGRRSKARDDCAVAAVLAVSSAERMPHGFTFEGADDAPKSSTNAGFG